MAQVLSSVIKLEGGIMAEPLAEGWIDIAEAVTLTGYSPVYVRLLAREDRVTAEKVGGRWLVNRASLVAFKVAMDQLGAQKHSPWRADLPEDRGRTV